VHEVESGTRLVDEAGKTMEQIVTSVKRVTDIMSEIAAASREQSSGIEEVGQAVMQMDQVTQQNAALVEEASAAAESLKEQARNLVQAVAVFKLAEGAQRPVERIIGGRPEASRPQAGTQVDRLWRTRGASPRFNREARERPVEETLSCRRRVAQRSVDVRIFMTKFDNRKWPCRGGGEKKGRGKKRPVFFFGPERTVEKPKIKPGGLGEVYGEDRKFFPRYGITRGRS